MTETFGLIPGRMTDQGCGIREGKFQDRDQKEIRALQVAPGDMARFIRWRSSSTDWRRSSDRLSLYRVGQEERIARKLAVHRLRRYLQPADSRGTHGSGMPTSKGMEATMELVQKA